MKRLVLIAAAALALTACARQGSSEADRVTRGQYLVTAVAGCNDCHTLMTANGPDMSRSLQGADLGFASTIKDAPWAPHAPQIAGIPDGFTRAQFVSFLQTGERPNGSHPLPPMPAYRLTAEDAEAVVAYIATLPKGANDAAPPKTP